MINQLLSTSFKTLGICGNCDRTGETFHLTPDVAGPTSDRLYSFKLNAIRLMALGADWVEHLHLSCIDFNGSDAIIFCLFYT